MNGTMNKKERSRLLILAVSVAVLLAGSAVLCLDDSPQDAEVAMTGSISTWEDFGSAFANGCDHPLSVDMEFIEGSVPTEMVVFGLNDHSTSRNLSQHDAYIMTKNNGDMTSGITNAAYDAYTNGTAGATAQGRVFAAYSEIPMNGEDLQDIRGRAIEDLMTFIGGNETIEGNIPESEKKWIDVESIKKAVVTGFEGLLDATDAEKVQSALDTAKANIMDTFKGVICGYLETVYNNGDEYNGLYMTEEQYEVALSDVRAAETPGQAISAYGKALGERTSGITITFMNGDAVFGEVSIRMGATPDVGTPTKDSARFAYTFRFWATSADGTEPVDWASLTGDTIVYACYEEATKVFISYADPDEISYVTEYGGADLDVARLQIVFEKKLPCAIEVCVDGTPVPLTDGNAFVGTSESGRDCVQLHINDRGIPAGHHLVEIKAIVDGEAMNVLEYSIQVRDLVRADFIDGDESVRKWYDRNEDVELPSVSKGGFTGWNVDGRFLEAGSHYKIAGNKVFIAQYGSDAEVVGIKVTTKPSDTEYAVGQALNLDGMVVTVTYSDGSSRAVTGYTTSPEAGDVLLTPGAVTVTVTYEGKTDSFTVSVMGAPLTDDTVAIVGEVQYSDLQAAFCAAKDGETVVLMTSQAHGDVIVSAGAHIKTGWNVTLDFNGRTLELKSMFRIDAGSTLKVIGDGTICTDPECVSGTLIANAGTLTIDGGTYFGSFADCNESICALIINCGTLLINRGGFDVEGGTDLLSVCVISGNVYHDDSSTVARTTVNGGTFAGRCGIFNGYGGNTTMNRGYFETQWLMVALAGSVGINGGSYDIGTFLVSETEIPGMPAFSGTIRVTGGTYSVPVPEMYIAEGYELRTNSNGTYTVVKTTPAVPGDDDGGFFFIPPQQEGGKYGTTTAIAVVALLAVIIVMVERRK